MTAPRHDADAMRTHLTNVWPDAHIITVPVAGHNDWTIRRADPPRHQGDPLMNDPRHTFWAQQGCNVCICGHYENDPYHIGTPAYLAVVNGISEEELSAPPLDEYQRGIDTGYALGHRDGADAVIAMIALDEDESATAETPDG